MKEQQQEVMESSSGQFWDVRYRNEGKIWGDNPSPTALTAAKYISPQCRVLDIGFGYGRDLPFLVQCGVKVYGIDPSKEGCFRAQKLLGSYGLQPECLVVSKFEDCQFSQEWFDIIISHRVIHLLISLEQVVDFSLKVQRLLRPEGILCIGTRDFRDLEPHAMSFVEEGVYEYRHRPGHRIRYWNDEALQKTFGEHFLIESLTHTTEQESSHNNTPCYLTVMVGRKTSPLVWQKPSVVR
jgi:SAM-dependent methyltransferase